MALNPPINNLGIPFRLEDEYVLVERKGMHIEVKVHGMSKLSGKGKTYLTSARLIFVHKNYKTDKFKAIDMPVALMGKVDFKQPVFGSNYLKFKCKPLFNMLPGEAEIKVWFTEGGCERFLRVFGHVSKQVYEQKRQKSMNNRLLQDWNQGLFNSKAFYDPSDPTVVFTEQPPIFDKNQPYIGNNIYINQDQQYPDMEGDNNQSNEFTPNFNQNQPYPPQPQQQGFNQPYPPQPQHQQGFNQPYPPQPQQGLNQPYPPQPQHQQGFNQPYPPQPQQGCNQPYPPQPQQGFINTPQQQPQGFINPNQHGHHQNPQNANNLPQMNNPYPAMNNNNQNAGYYFGFFGPKLESNQNR